MKQLIHNIRLIHEHGITPDKAVLIDGERIAAIVDAHSYDHESVDKVYDGRGRYLAAGFIDIHTHGNSGYDTMDASPEAIEAMGEFHIQNGVTSFLLTTLTSTPEALKKALKTAREFIDEQDSQDTIARVLGVYFEGPYFNEEKKGAQPASAIATPDAKQMDDYILSSGGTIKVVALAPELEGGIDLIKQLSSARITTSIAHTNGTYEDAQAAYANGASLTTHLYNGMRGFSHREPGIAGAALTHDAFAELIVDRHHLHDAAVDLALRAKGSDQLILVSDAIRATGLPSGTYDLGGQRITAEDGKVTLEDGSLAGSTLTLPMAIHNITTYNNLPLFEAVKMATINPARAIGVDDAYGSVEKGKYADLVMFDDVREITTVFKSGEIMEWKK